MTLEQDQALVRAANEQRRLRKITPYSPEWQRLANQEARNFAPTIYPCAKCSYPYVSGYCCTFCGDCDPSS